MIRILCTRSTTVQESGRSGSTDTPSGPAPEPVRQMVLLQPEGEHSPKLDAKDSHLVFPEEMAQKGSAFESLSTLDCTDLGYAALHRKSSFWDRKLWCLPLQRRIGDATNGIAAPTHHHHEYPPCHGDFLVCYFCFLTYFARFLEYHLSKANPRPFPYQEFPTLHALCEATLRRFSKRNLLACTEGRLALSAQIRPPEAQFQDEFYRALNNLLGSSVAVSSEWSRCGDGRIDFRIVETGWGVEMPRDGDRLSGHCGRFVQGGSYDGWINQGWIKDWIVLDCRHSRPLPYGVKGTKLWRVIFSEGYSSACVWDSENQVIIKEFPLMN